MTCPSLSSLGLILLVIAGAAAGKTWTGHRKHVCPHDKLKKHDCCVASCQGGAIFHFHVAGSRCGRVNLWVFMSLDLLPVLFCVITLVLVVLCGVVLVWFQSEVWSERSFPRGGGKNAFLILACSHPTWLPRAIKEPPRFCPFPVWSQLCQLDIETL